MLNVKLLSKLAEFLEKLPRTKFDFNQIVAESDGKCGTICCAVGWLPAVDPTKFRWVTDDKKPIRKVGIGLSFGLTTDFTGLRKTLGLSHWEIDYLFVPGMSHLGVKARPKAVARHIKDFVKLRLRIPDAELDIWYAFLRWTGFKANATHKGYLKYKESYET